MLSRVMHMIIKIKDYDASYLADSNKVLPQESKSIDLSIDRSELRVVISSAVEESWSNDYCGVTDRTGVLYLSANDVDFIIDLAAGLDGFELLAEEERFGPLEHEIKVLEEELLAESKLNENIKSSIRMSSYSLSKFL